MFALFGLGVAEIVVLALIGGFVLFIMVMARRRTNPGTSDDQAALQRLRDKVDELRAENNRLREENDRLRESGPPAAVTPPETGIKQTET